jgi:DNA-binding NarL/FixJ family response regulator
MTVEMLTPRQLEIVDHLKRGLTNKQIGRQLGITEGTIKVHLNQIYDRMNVNNRTELVGLLLTSQMKKPVLAYPHDQGGAGSL